MRLSGMFFFLFLCTVMCRSYGQDTASSTRSTVLENKIGTEFNIPLDSSGRHSLCPSVRTVFSDHRKSDDISTFRGSQIEVNYTYSPWDFMSFSADMEVDFTRGGETILSAYVSASPRYKYKRVTMYGELKFSSNRRLSYHDHLSSPHLNYMAGAGVDAIKDVMYISAQCTFPHDLQTNAFDKIKAETKMKITISRRVNIGLTVGMEQSFDGRERTYTNKFTVGYSF